jgi:hypothetical protein
MENMKYYIFYREDNNFDDILTDTIIKKLFDFKIKWSQYLMLGSSKVSSETYSYMLLKYGDDLKRKSDIFIDRSPVPRKDYTLDSRRPKKFENL